MSLIVKLRDGDIIIIAEDKHFPQQIEPLYLEEDLVEWAKTGEGRSVQLFLKNEGTVDQEVAFRMN